MFVTILLFCDLSSPRRLWDQTWEAISEDILYKKRKQFRYPSLELTDEQTQNYCLVELQELLHKNGKSLSDFQDLPEPDTTLLTNMDNRLIRDELSYNMKQLKAEHEKLHASLNPYHLCNKKQENFSLFTDQEALGKHSCTRQSSPE